MIAEASPRPMARITGVVYLLYFLTAISGELFIRGMIVSDDPAATAINILAHERSFRLSGSHRDGAIHRGNGSLLWFV